MEGVFLCMNEDYSMEEEEQQKLKEMVKSGKARAKELEACRKVCETGLLLEILLAKLLAHHIIKQLSVRLA
jgi:uncharacterized protein (UPF0210 family)